MAHVLHGNKFPFAHLYFNMYSYLLINFSDIINDDNACSLMT